MCYNINEKDEILLCMVEKGKNWGEKSVTEKELKRLNRYQLLELLIIQTNRADTLQKELEEVQEKLEAKEIQMSSVGSVAEAAVQISGVLEAAQRTADLYMEAVEKRGAEIEAEAHDRAGEILENARREAERILDFAKRQAENLKR